MKYVGQRPDRPETPAQKVAAIHHLADDDQVAVQLATDVLRRPGVGAWVVADDTARHAVNRAKTDRSQQQAAFRRETPAGGPSAGSSGPRSCWTCSGPATAS